MNDAATIIAALAAAVIVASATITFGRWAWNQFWACVARRIATHIDRTLGPEPTNRYRDLDTEYRQLVLDEHNKDA